MANEHRHFHNNERRVGWAALLTGLFMLGEIAGGILSGSLALLADAGHMFADFLALAMAWAAFRIARRPANWRFSFGFDRFQILVAFANGLSLFVIAGWIILEAASRLLTPHDVMGGTMLAVALVGLGVNMAAFLILAGAERENLNIRAAAIHVMGDLLGSLAAILAAIIILLTDWMLADPLLSLLVALLILKSAWGVVRKAGHILLEGAPDGLDSQAVAADLVANISGVESVHHVHIWSITQERPMMTLHARLAEISHMPAHHSAFIVAAIKARLAERFGVNSRFDIKEMQTKSDHYPTGKRINRN
jgi:cobalt-zinc-cadmium efflux system protein